MIITDKEAEQTYLFSKKIEFELDGNQEFVELREFNMEEMKQFQLAANAKGNDFEVVPALSKAEEFFPKCVVNSSFSLPGGEKADGKTVYNYLKKSSSLFQVILTEWLKGGDSPFQLLNKKN